MNICVFALKHCFVGFRFQVSVELPKSGFGECSIMEGAMPDRLLPVQHSVECTRQTRRQRKRCAAEVMAQEPKTEFVNL